MHTTPEPRWERWMIGIGEAMTTIWPAAAFHHRPIHDPRRDHHVDWRAETVAPPRSVRS